MIRLDETSETSGHGKPNAGRATPWELLLIAGQLALVLFAMYQFNVFERGIMGVFTLAFAGFVVHAMAPLKYRLHVFLGISLAGTHYILGPTDTLWLVMLSLALIGVCHLPASFHVRVGVLAAAGLLLAILRASWALYPSVARVLPEVLTAGESWLPWSGALWPILSAMLMFRLVIYLYDIEHDEQRPTVVRTLSYFFMVPTVCFPLFPVIDYRRFCRTYYSGGAFDIYQRGVSWIFRGVVQLLLYRLVYHGLVLDPLAVSGFWDVVQFSLAAYLLYLQVSGHFHVIVGVLLLFGFNLPETHHLYYLASSFTDFWRRINIYWKDFVMKVVYYPTHVRLRRFGPAPALVGATLATFMATWWLHAYQWFWLRGEMLLAWHDVLFWGMLGLLVVVNALREMKYGRSRAIGEQRLSAWARVALWCRTAATFLTICFLWGMWSSDSFAQWMGIWRSAGQGWLWTVLVIAGVYGASRACEVLDRRGGERQRGAVERVSTASRRWDLRHVAVRTMAGALLLCIAGTSLVYANAPGTVRKVIGQLRFADLNQADIGRQERGYYEDLVGVNRQNIALLSAYSKRPKNWKGTVTRRRPNDFITAELIPNLEVESGGAVVITNEWGMRDRSYEKAKGREVVRLAMLGASHAYGFGVNNEETFENVLEGEWSRKPPGSASSRYEVLNFSVGGRSPLEQPAVLERLVLEFRPDVLVYVAHPGDSWRAAVEFLPRYLPQGLPVPYAYIGRIMERADIRPGLSRFEIARRLRPYGMDLLAGAYSNIVETCRRHGIVPILVVLPLTYDPTAREVVRQELEIAREAGFTVVPMLDVYAGYDPQQLAIAPWDNHPNALGHRLVAERLDREFRRLEETLFGATLNTR